ncbi:MAG: hypothetical protein RIS09_242 [Actinomycetota bacterium]
MSQKLALYDTRARATVEIEPAQPSAYSLYACGPTVYRYAHVGNMRTFLLTDLIRRAITLKGDNVTVIQNITDVGHMLNDEGLTEDRMLVQAEVEQKDPLDIARFYERAYLDDLSHLNIQKPDIMPRASEHINLMIEMISKLLEHNMAYIGADGSVFFDARSVSDYGAISGNRLSDLKPGHRFDGEVDSNKRFHADWALWKIAPSTRHDLTWETPWGRGFPGWHIECSAMSIKYLGTAIDIHTGGIDLRFPHHENERAQSNAYAGDDVVKHWVHAEHLLFEGRKMAKSTGNVVLVSDVIAKGFDPLALRLAFMQVRYRSQMDLSWQSIKSADAHIQRWRSKVSNIEAGALPETLQSAITDLWLRDLDTPAVLATLFEAEKSLRDTEFITLLLWADSLLGIDVARRVQLEIPQDVTLLVHKREIARREKNWQLSDELRLEIEERGFEVKDSPSGPTITRRLNISE